MSAFIDAFKLSYFSVPKTACTTLKTAFFALENGRPFADFRCSGKWYYIHNFYPSSGFKAAPHDRIADHARFAVVRDPLARAVSCYRNRVVHYRELGPGRISDEFVEKGAVPDPSLDYFLRRLQLYREASVSIRHHTDPLTFFLGTDPAYFDTIYAMRDIDKFAERVAQITKRTMVLGREQTGGPNITPDQVSDEVAERVREFYAQDYQVFGRYL
ncbi:sulfotransferase family 2 domain-containing protein [Halodurantibacterium flavum]|uniref:Sulfotransferase family 2 domain-containing protein n=1 Tax=Halodurantibacterium flavum TaxID=1382802 RepID=A0ABW4S410_9RHOB